MCNFYESCRTEAYQRRLMVVLEPSEDRRRDIGKMDPVLQSTNKVHPVSRNVLVDYVHDHTKPLAQVFESTRWPARSSRAIIHFLFVTCQLSGDLWLGHPGSSRTYRLVQFGYELL